MFSTTSRPFLGFTNGKIAIVSADSRQLYRFDQYDRHLNTVDAPIGMALYTFAYDSERRLSSIANAGYSVTTIERGDSSNPAPSWLPRSASAPP